MSSPISDGIALGVAAIALTACSGASSQKETGQKIDCFVNGAGGLAQACTLEPVNATSFIVRHPDGGFRRFVYSRDGKLTTDGAEQPFLSQEGEGVMQLSISGNVYRLPQEHRKE